MMDRKLRLYRVVYEAWILQSNDLVKCEAITFASGSDEAITFVRHSEVGAKRLKIIGVEPLAMVWRYKVAKEKK